MEKLKEVEYDDEKIEWYTNCVRYIMEIDGEEFLNDFEAAYQYFTDKVRKMKLRAVLNER